LWERGPGTFHAACLKATERSSSPATIILLEKSTATMIAPQFVVVDDNQPEAPASSLTCKLSAPTVQKLADLLRQNPQEFDTTVTRIHQSFSNRVFEASCYEGVIFSV
jgi:hypothetical protein